MMTAAKDIDISIVDIFILLIDDKNLMKEICDKTIKSFLPIMNKPILFYQLEFLERQNIKEVHLLVNKDNFVLTNTLTSGYFGPIKIDLIEINDQGLDIFTKIKSKLTKNNFILIEGDSILSFNLSEFLDFHIDNKNLVSLILQKKDLNFTKFAFSKDETLNAFGVDEDNNNKIVFYNKRKPDSNDALKINKEILKRCECFKLLLNYMDVGFYIFNDSVFHIIDAINDKDTKDKNEQKIKIKVDIESIKEDFIPFLVKNTFYKKLNMVLINNYDGGLLKANRIRINAKIINNDKNVESEYCYKIYDYPSYFATIEEIQKPYDDIRPIFFQTKNNEKNYFFNFAEKIQENIENKKRYNDGIPELANISENSYIASKGEKIEKGVKINKTVAQPNMEIKEGSQVISCLIGTNSVIGKNCKLTNCIIGKDTSIGDNCEISECIISDSYNVAEKTSASQKILSKENEDVDFS